jgi:hypothetical protein
MKPYDGCHVTFEVPRSFKLGEEKRLRAYYNHDLPGVGVRVEYRQDVTKARPSELSIDPHACVRTVKASEKSKNKSETVQLEDDPFAVVVQAVVQTFNRFKRKATLQPNRADRKGKNVQRTSKQ